MRRTAALLLAPVLLAPVLLAGCTVGPDYQPPELAVSEAWLEAARTDPVDPQWWAAFSDPQMTALVERALEESPTVAAAQARLREARALREAAQGGRLPQGEASASVTRNRLSENGAFPVANIPGFDPTFTLFDAGFDASWEIDLWGETSRAIESARAGEQAAQWALRDVRISLAAEVARTYLDYRAAGAALELLGGEAEAAATIARLSALLHEAGEADRATAERARAAAEGAQAALEMGTSDRAALAYRLSVLTGIMPENLLPQLQAPVAEPATPAVIASGIRSELLRRRPDVRQAERELAAANAAIGVATAQLYPAFSLMGGIGFQAQDAGDLLDGSSLRYAAGPGFRWPLFSLGRLRAQVRAADARAEAAAARYEAAVIAALAESESAANRFAAANAAARASRAALDREQEAFTLARLRHERGEDSRLALEQARLQLIRVDRQERAARTVEARAAVALYKALGGGWAAAGEPTP